MTRCVCAHATHPDWRIALGLVAAQLPAGPRQDGQAAQRVPASTLAGWQATLGWLYFTDHYAGEADALLAAVCQRWPGVHWVGGVGVGIAASGVEYIDEPALVVMLADLPTSEFRVFSGAEPLLQGGERSLGFDAATALVHADPSTPDLAELIAEMSDRTRTGYLFGGLTSSRASSWQVANGLFQGGLSGVAFSPRVPIVSRVTQGCQPVGPTRRITRAERNLILELDGAPALDCLLQDVDASESDPRQALAKLQRVLVGLSAEPPGAKSQRRGPFGDDTVVRHLAGFDPPRRGVAVADIVQVDQYATFCGRDVAAARRDLVRVCTEIRDELEPENWPTERAEAAGADGTPGAPGSSNGLTAAIAGAVYVSCTGRGGPHFGGPSAELQLIQHALGDVPLVGFFAAGEIARQSLFGYTGVLTVFRAAG
jgi:small ligand-binding sensory domain FIST